MHLMPPPWQQQQRVNALCKNTVREVERREEEGGCNIPQKPLKLALKTTLEWSFHPNRHRTWLACQAEFSAAHYSATISDSPTRMRKHLSSIEWRCDPPSLLLAAAWTKSSRPEEPLLHFFFSKAKNGQRGASSCQFSKSPAIQVKSLSENSPL